MYMYTFSLYLCVQSHVESINRMCQLSAHYWLLNKKCTTPSLIVYDQREATLSRKN